MVPTWPRCAPPWQTPPHLSYSSQHLIIPAASAATRRHLPRCRVLSAILTSCASQLIWRHLRPAPPVVPGPRGVQGSRASRRERVLRRELTRAAPSPEGADPTTGQAQQPQERTA